ncbi:hypothetical protein Tco_0848308 [Tanacetum coccineum]
MVKHDVEVESSGECVDEIDKLTEAIDRALAWLECVDEIDKLAELIGEMQLKQEDRSCVHASNKLHLMSFMLLHGKQWKLINIG